MFQPESEPFVRLVFKILVFLNQPGLRAPVLLFCKEVQLVLGLQMRVGLLGFGFGSSEFGSLKF